MNKNKFSRAIADAPTFFSFGGGVQSSGLAALLVASPEVFAAKGIPLPNQIIFADTGAERGAVLQNVEVIFQRLRAKGFDCVTVQKEGDTIESDRGLASAPWFFPDEEGKRGQLPRQCTSDYKIRPIQKAMRALQGIAPRQRNNTVNLWLGISTDEARRAKPDASQWVNRMFPLLDLGLDRGTCSILSEKVFGYAPPKSACYFCPYTHPSQWITLRNNDPDTFQRAVEVDKRLRQPDGSPKLRGAKYGYYVHPSLSPLADLPDQGEMFSEECQGFCGV
jgi:hypothetical protein